MLYKSPIFSQASGSLAGNVFSRNRGGQYVRARGLVTNPNSPAQQVIRTTMANLVVAWRSSLTDSQRTAWATYAANVPVTNRVGDQIFLTGQQHYLRSNAPRVRAGKTRVDGAPFVFNLGTLSPISITAAAGAPGTIDVSFANTDPWAGTANGALLIQAGVEVNSTVNFFKAPFQYVDKIDGAVVAPTSPATLTLAIPLNIGNKIFVRGRATTADGRLTDPQIVSAIVA